jgi:tetratricopeptide (TPR) repeat protein
VADDWLFLPEAAAPLMLAAVEEYGPQVLGESRAAGPSAAAIVGRDLLRLVFGPADRAAGPPDVLARLAPDPAGQQAAEALTSHVHEFFEADPAAAAGAAALIAAFHRERASGGEVQALVDLGDFLYWDRPEEARAAYEEAIDAGHQHALIDLAVLLRCRGDEPAALAAYRKAADNGDPDLAAEAWYQIAVVHASRRDEAAAAAMFRQVIDTGHPEWASAAMVGLAGMLRRTGDEQGAEAWYREAIRAGNPDWSAHASVTLGDLLQRKGDADGAKDLWRRVIESPHDDWAGPAFVRLVNLLRNKDDAFGLRAAYEHGAAVGNPDALYALLQLGQVLESRGDVGGAHAAWQQAIDAGCEDPGYWRERMSPPPPRRREAEPYPAGLPPAFDPGNMLQTGVDVLEHGLPPLPAQVTYQMAIPVAYWAASRRAVVLFLRFCREEAGDRWQPLVVMPMFAREGDSWSPPSHCHGMGWSHDPIADPGSLRDLGGQALVTGGGSDTVLHGRVTPEVKEIGLIQDGRADRRALESHFGAWVVCTDGDSSFEVQAYDAGGNVLSRVTSG